EYGSPSARAPEHALHQAARSRSGRRQSKRCRRIRRFLRKAVERRPATPWNSGGRPVRRRAPRLPSRGFLQELSQATWLSRLICGRACGLLVPSLISDEMYGGPGNDRHDPDDGHHEPLILIVEDDPETRRLYVDALKLHGFRTDDAHNGLQALEKAFAVTPDLVLADIAVPGIDGIELCRRLRADIRTRDVPVLAVTGYENRRYTDRALSAGADRVLIKPC